MGSNPTPGAPYLSIDAIKTLVDPSMSNYKAMNVKIPLQIYNAISEACSEGVALNPSDFVRAAINHYLIVMAPQLVDEPPELEEYLMKRHENSTFH